MGIKENLSEVREKICNAELKCGRPQGSVKLLAVSKFHPAEAVVEAIKQNQFLFGENRVQEACSKFTDIVQNNPNVELHLIGQLQSNKVKKACGIADCIQSVDRIELLQEIEKHCASIDKKIKVLFEVHTGEESKSGFEDKAVVYKALDLCANGDFPHIIPCGFMTMAPFTQNQAEIHKSFASLYELSQKAQNDYRGFNLTELSMGMSGDFEAAIAEGSTMVRIGTAIFGERNY